MNTLTEKIAQVGGTRAFFLRFLTAILVSQTKIKSSVKETKTAGTGFLLDFNEIDT